MIDTLKACPIEPEEVSEFIKRVKIGDTYKLPERDPWESRKIKFVRYRVIEKYPHFCRLQRGNRIQTRSYIQLMIGED